MVLTCSVNGCFNRQRGGGTVSFHRFPSNEAMEYLWVAAIGRTAWKPSNHSFVCSDHFWPKDYQDRPGAYIPLLKPAAFPTKFEFCGPGYELRDRRRPRKKLLMTWPPHEDLKPNCEPITSKPVGPIDPCNVVILKNPISSLEPTEIPGEFKISLQALIENGLEPLSEQNHSIVAVETKDLLSNTESIATETNNSSTNLESISTMPQSPTAGKDLYDSKSDGNSEMHLDTGYCEIAKESSDMDHLYHQVKLLQGQVHLKDKKIKQLEEIVAKLEAEKLKTPAQTDEHSYAILS